MSRRLFTDETGRLAAYKDIDVVEPFTIQWGDRLFNDSIQSSSWVGENVSLTKETNTPKTASVFIQGSSGSATNTIITALGQTLKRTIQVYDRDSAIE